MKVLFDLLNNQVALEGDGADLVSLLKLVQEIAPKLKEIRIIPSGSASNPSGITQQSDQQGNGGQQNRPSGNATMREFARRVGPANISERIAAIGSYKVRFEGVKDFSPKEMGEWFGMCGFERPSQMPVAMSDAKRKYGYVDSVGHGRWKISTSGLNLVTRKEEQIGKAE